MPESALKTPETTHEIFMQRYMEEKDVEANCSCGVTHGDTSNPWKSYLLYPLLHTLKVAGFIFVVNFLLAFLKKKKDKFAAFSQLLLIFLKFHYITCRTFQYITNLL